MPGQHLRCTRRKRLHDKLRTRPCQRSRRAVDDSTNDLTPTIVTLLVALGLTRGVTSASHADQFVLVNIHISRWSPVIHVFHPCTGSIFTIDDLIHPRSNPLRRSLLDHTDIVQEKEMRLNLGLQKLIQGAKDVEAMKIVLAEEQKKLEVATAETMKMLSSLEVSSAEARKEGDQASTRGGGTRRSAPFHPPETFYLSTRSYG